MSKKKPVSFDILNGSIFICCITILMSIFLIARLCGAGRKDKHKRFISHLDTPLCKSTFSEEVLWLKEQ